MHSNESWHVFDEQLRQSFPELSDAELKEVHNSFYYTSCEATDPIVTDIDNEPEPPYLRALNGRYWIFLRLQDFEYWYEHHETYEGFSGHLPFEPAIVAAALALRPADNAAWDAVEAWAWVYRHALMLQVGLDDVPTTPRKALVMPSCSS